MMNLSDLMTKLNYQDLQVNNYVPALHDYIDVKSKRYPQFVYKSKSTEWYEIFHRRVVLELFNQTLDLNQINNNPNNSYKYSPEELTTYCDKTLKELTNFINEDLSNLTNVSISYLVQNEYMTDTIDIMAENYMVDVVVSNDKSLLLNKLLQLFIKTLIVNKNNIKYIGILLPLQLQFICLEIDSEVLKSYEVLTEYCNNRVIRINTEIRINKDFYNRVGCHTSRSKSEDTEFNLYPSLQNHVRHNSNLLLSVIDSLSYDNVARPCQMFLKVPQSGKIVKFSDNDLLYSSEYIKKLNIPYYTHSPYLINLASNESTLRWVLKLLLDDLELTNKIGGKGVVVHVGKYKDLDIEEALNNMETSIKKVLQALPIDTTCPLLLETPAGEGTELCVIIETMIAFYDRFDTEEKTKLKLCVDTCHVFAASYDPYEYLVRWSSIHGSHSIGLVHLNDSKGCMGCKVDRHAFLGQGHIGGHNLYEVIDWCNNHKIDMIIE